MKLRFKDIEIEADDLQLKVPTYEVKARKAKLKFGKETRNYDELYFKLNQRKGVGITQYLTDTLKIVPSRDQ